MLPTLSFGVFAAAAPWMTRRFADARILVAAMVLLAGGLLVRAATDSTPVFLLSTAVALSGIAVANVLLPSLVKQRFPGHVGLMTGVYTVALIISTAGGSAATVPVAELGGSWRVGLGAWALLAAVAALSWLPAAVAGRAGTGPVATGGGARTGGAVPLGGAQAVAPGADTPTGTAAATGATAAVGRVRVRPWRSGLGWAMAVFFGAQSLVAYAIMGWLAQLYRDAGFTPASAGLVVAFVNGLGVPGWAGRWRCSSAPRPWSRTPSWDGSRSCTGTPASPRRAPAWWSPSSTAWAFRAGLGDGGVLRRPGPGRVRHHGMARAAVPGRRLHPGERRPGGRLRQRPGRSGLGWAMAVFFGAQALVAYAIMGWLAQLYRDAGFTPASAGLVVAFVNGLGVPGWAGRWRCSSAPRPWSRTPSWDGSRSCTGTPASPRRAPAWWSPS